MAVIKREQGRTTGRLTSWNWLFSMKMERWQWVRITVALRKVPSSNNSTQTSGGLEATWERNFLSQFQLKRVLLLSKYFPTSEEKETRTIQSSLLLRERWLRLLKDLVTQGQKSSIKTLPMLYLMLRPWLRSVQPLLLERDSRTGLCLKMTVGLSWGRDQLYWCFPAK